jgi:hypothetical protein
VLFVITQSSRRRELGGSRPLSPRLYALKHPALHQQCAKEPERIRQWTERSRTRFTAVSVQQAGMPSTDGCSANDQMHAEDSPAGFRSRTSALPGSTWRTDRN